MLKRQIGRIVELYGNPVQAILLFQNGLKKKIVSQNYHLGDWVEIKKNHAFLLQRASVETVFDYRRVKNYHVRLAVEDNIRTFFKKYHFQETRTNILVENPGMEAHIRPFQINKKGHTQYLHTSPEFSMKELLASGFSQIYQMVPCFRDEPVSLTHLPEYLMLEWYCVFEPLETIFQDVVLH